MEHEGGGVEPPRVEEGRVVAADTEILANLADDDGRVAVARDEPDAGPHCSPGSPRTHPVFPANSGGAPATTSASHAGASGSARGESGTFTCTRCRPPASAMSSAVARLASIGPSPPSMRMVALAPERAHGSALHVA